MKHYSLDYSGMKTERRVVAPPEGRHVYVFQLFDGGLVEVFKFLKTELAAAAARGESPSALLGEPTYVIVEGSCSCPGFSYRAACRHMETVTEFGWR